MRTTNSSSIPEDGLVKVLLIEDDLAYANLIQDKINHTSTALFQVIQASTLAEATPLFHQHNFRLILLDLFLPDGQGLETLSQIYQLAPDIPIVVLTGDDDEQIALTAVKTGVQDYLIKNHIANEDVTLTRTLQYAVERQNLRREASQRAQSLQRQKNVAETMFDSIEPQTTVLDYQGVIISVNESWKRFAFENEAPSHYIYLGVNYFDVCRRAIQANVPGMQECLAGMIAVRNGTLPRFNFEYPCHSPTEERWFMMQVAPLQSDEGGLVVSHVNISETKKAQLQLNEIYRNLDIRTQNYHISLSQGSIVKQPIADNDASALPNDTHKQQLLAKYQDLVSDYVRAVRTREDRPKIKVRDLAEAFARHQFRAKDVVAIHLSVLETLTQTMTSNQERQLANDARLVLLELMGHLTDLYATKAQGNTA
ncbi:MAG: response regulator [Chloroflexota bacterium]